MTIALITDTTPVCYGVMCDKHARCSRYAAVDKTRGDYHAIATCLQGDDRPLFIEIKKEVA